MAMCKVNNFLTCAKQISSKTFNAGAATADNPESFIQEQAAPVTTRLGYIELSSSKWGTFRFGKQWSVYYDVTGYTDMFNVFGGNASGTYNTGTDGGGEGTGRAESAITYHKTVKNLTLGVQMQFPGSMSNYAASLVYQLPYGFIAGASYNCYDIPKNLQENIINPKSDANSVAALLMYTNKKFNIALTYAFNQSETQYPNDTAIVGFSAKGIELYTQYNITTKLMIVGGGKLPCS